MKIAIMGYGTIGSGVAEVLEVNQEILAERAGEALEVKYSPKRSIFMKTSVNKKYCVYMHINTINGKRYVGITSKIPEERISFLLLSYFFWYWHIFEA